MTSSTGKTGIDIELKLSDGMKAFGDAIMPAFKALHLNGLVKLMVGNTSLVTTIDGVEHRDPYLAPHFLECPPGEHEIDVAIQGAAAEMMSHRKLKVTVEPGKVTVVRYTQGMGPGNFTLEPAGTRPA